MVNKKRRKKSRKMKIFIALIIIAILAVIVGRNISKGKKVKPIKTNKVRIGNVEERLTETGNIELVRTVDVKSKIAGKVQEIFVRDGDRVKTGQILCVIDPDPTQTLLLFQKRSAVDRTRINLDQTKKELERKRELAKTALISEKELEDALNAHQIAQNALNLAGLELDIMEKEIETTGTGSEERIVSSMVRAPIDGVITQRYVEEGVLVTSGISSVVAGTNLFQIGDPSTRIITTYISEVDIGKVMVGMPVRIILDAYPDTSFAGEIRHISPVGKTQQGRNVIAFKTEVEILDEDPCLKPGMSCDVDVILDKEENVRYLPIESVYKRKEGSKEDGNETIRHLVYLKAETDSTKKEFMSFFKKKPNPLDDFTKTEIDVGIRSENRIYIHADYDTSIVVAADAEQMFKDKEALKKEREKKKKKASEKEKKKNESNDATGSKQNPDSTSSSSDSTQNKTDKSENIKTSKK